MKTYTILLRRTLAAMLAATLAITTSMAQDKPIVDNTITPERKVLQLRDSLEAATTVQRQKSLLTQIGNLGTFQSYVVLKQYASFPKLKRTCAKWLRSHHALAKQASQFTSLFNGRDLTGWKGLVENPIARAKMTKEQLQQAQAKADETMRNDWIVENGLLAYVGTGFDNICTQEQYGNFELYLDWKLDPSGKEPDAGVYLRGTPQVQIWDTARVNVGAQVGSGGLYNNKKNRSTPLVVADNAVGQWNTFYIRMVGDRVTVKLNGILVVDDVPLENYWDRSQPLFPVEQIELQAHGSKVFYRDIYVRKLP